MRLRYSVPGEDFNLAGRASAEMKKVLAQLGVEPAAIKRAAVAMYEAEINMVIHAGGGEAVVDISPERVLIILADHGPGIPNLELAMQEGYTTAPEWIQEMGFGAGMGLPNMKRNSDELRIDTEAGKGTTVTIVIHFTRNAGQGASADSPSAFAEGGAS
jgi:anti-sigma regulatory factor (Ser/Thr protein kinase)